MSYKVNTATYSGPFDLLLQLVSRQKVAIGSISISEVADQYLAEVDAMEELDLDVASDFVLVASTLLDMKAHALVPQDVSLKSSYDEDEYDDELDGLSPDEAREVLIARLIAYKQFRNAGAALGSRMEAESYMFPRSVGPDPDFLNLMPDYLEGITLRSLAVICADIDSKRETFLLEAEHVAPKRLPVALTVASVDRLTRSKGKVTFSELLDGQDTPEIVVANFLAVLELFKRGLVRVQQDVIFGEIEIEHIEGADSYQLDESVLLELEELSGDEPDLEGFNLSQNALDDVQQTLLSLTQTPDEAQKEAE
ncbi:MAG: segregation/condensation protein A [Atopobium sp.]|jgi:scpA/B protein|uniref:Segregation and condensation protein A n=1 Tax=Lancefieldella parvula TaxID=1382 RepID=A0A9D5X5L4_9ACTN|nr:segregation/condensation protein A [Lancefieldella parvula]KGF14615.1 chromosome segregation protein ScpA [Lancefieldella parvula DNF00906]MBF4803147.1 segregation/condensation protein A [Lancefieldella parvula]MDU5217338.1 segregation/condensation protein A [Atopobium sp.]